MLRVPFSGRGFFDSRRRSAENRAFSPPALGDDSRKKHAFSENPVRPRFFALRARVGRDDFCGGKSISRAKPERGAHGGALSSPFTRSLRPFSTSRERLLLRFPRFSVIGAERWFFLTDWRSQKAAPLRGFFAALEGAPLRLKRSRIASRRNYSDIFCRAQKIAYCKISRHGA